MNEQELKDLFANYRPMLSDNAEFMQTIEKKLEAVEYVKRYNAAAKRRSRIALAVAFVLGGVAGCVAMLMFDYVPRTDLNAPVYYTIQNNGLAGLITIVKHYAPWIYMLTFSGVAIIGIVNLVLSWQSMDFRMVRK